MQKKIQNNKNASDLKGVTIVPLGGLGEIGLNCLAIEYQDEILIIDAGLMFPEDESMPGVDVVIPDFTYLEQKKDFIKAIILTHGHEDHIGALGYLCHKLNSVDIYGTRLTLALALARLNEHSLTFKPNLIEVEPRQKVKITSFEVEFIEVNHSILDGVALGISTPAGIILHTGDFKIDQNPISGNSFDLYKFAQYGEKGVLLLLSDSTNAELAGHTESEAVVGKALSRIFSESSGRIILACFASSLARIKQVCLAAVLTQRKIFFAGRSMLKIMDLAKKLDLIKLPLGLEVSMEELSSIEDHNLLVVATGSQGEPMSVLSRMANNEHKHLKIYEGDTIILSARSIPGNERAITHLIDKFYNLGAKVIYGRESLVHTSGHAQAEELKTMLNLVKPKYLVPIHGELRHLFAHADLAKEMGWSDEDVIVLKNGETLFLLDGNATLSERVPTGRWLVDGKGFGLPYDPVLQKRLSLSEAGLVVVSVGISTYGKISGLPKVALLGVHYENEFDLSLETIEVVKEAILKWQNQHDALLKNNAEELKKLEKSLISLIQRKVRALFKNHLKRRPEVLSQIIFIND